MDRVDGQFYAVYKDGYRKMVTTKRLLYPWQSGQLVAELHDTRLQFGLPPRHGPSFVHQPATSQCLLQSVIQEARAATSTQPRKMKLYPTSLMRHHSPEPYTTKNPHSAWKDQTTCSKCMKGLRFITITLQPSPTSYIPFISLIG